MEGFRDKGKLIKEIDIKLKTLTNKLNEISKSFLVHKINNLSHHSYYTFNSAITKYNCEIDKLKKEKDYILSNDYEHEYILNTCKYINDYLLLEEKERQLITNNTNADADTEKYYEISIKKKDIVNSYMSYINPNYIQELEPVSNLCKTCNVPFSDKNGFACCILCGNTTTTVHVANELGYKEAQDFDFRQAFQYQKSSHLDDWIRRFQSKENKEIPQSILDQVLLEAHKERVTDLNLLTEEKVKSYLKKLNLNTYYGNVICIINKLNKRPPFTLTPEIEKKIKTMFNQIQKPFEKFKNTERVNLLSYSYLIHQFFLILDLPEFAKYFTLLKNNEKLRQHDEIFKKIIDELAKTDNKTHWRFFPLA